MPASPTERSWVVSWSSDREGVLSIDPAWKEITGQSSISAKVNGLYETILDVDRDHFITAFRDSLHSKRGFRLITKIRCSDGLSHQVMVVAAPQWDHGRVFSGFAGSIFNLHEDETEIVRKGGGNALGKSEERSLRYGGEERLKRILETDAVGVLFFNYSGTVIDANEVFLRTTGYTRAEIDAGDLHWRKMTPPEYVSESEEQMRRFSQTGRIGPYEKEFSLKDGSRRWMLFAGRDLNDGTIVEYCVDISDRKRAEATLSEARAQLNAFLNNSALIAWMKDADGRHVFLSENYQRRFNVCHENWVGKTDFELWPKDVAERFRENDIAVLRSGQAIEALEKADCGGKVTWWLNSKFPYVDSAGRHYVGGIGVEVTERELAQAALKESDKRKDEFIAVLAHELRNPLTPIYNLIHVLQRKHGTSDPDAALLDMIQRQTAHLIRLVDDLLDISRINSGKIELRKERVNLSFIIHDALDACDFLLKHKSHQISVKAPSKSLCVFGDPIRLTQIIVNLVNNAAKYTPSGGMIEIEAARDDDRVTCRVRDNGVGLAPDKLTQVFELFTQIEGREQMSGGGLGIGLALARKLVEMHAGTITAYSAGIGRGSEFVVSLPAYSGQHILTTLE